MGNQMRLLLLLLTYTRGSVLWCQLYTFWSSRVHFSKRFLQKICQHAWASTPHWICLPLGKHLDSSHKDIAVPVCFQDLKSGTDKRWCSSVNTDRFIYKASWLRVIGSGLALFLLSFLLVWQVAQQSIQNVVRTAVLLLLGADCHLSLSRFLRCMCQP